MAQFSRIFAILWAAVIAVMSLIPGEDVPQVGLSDKIEHAIGYCALSFLFSLGWRRPLPAWAAATFYGIAIELAQGVTASRTPDPYDALANTIGAAIGALAFILAARFLLPRLQRP